MQLTGYGLVNINSVESGVLLWCSVGLQVELVTYVAELDKELTKRNKMDWKWKYVLWIILLHLLCIAIIRLR